MKIINSIATQIFEGTTNEKVVVDRLNAITDTSLLAHTELSFVVAASTTDQAVSLTGFTPTKYVLVNSDIDITVKFAIGGTAFVGKQFYVGASVTTILITTSTVAANVNVIVAK